MNLGTLLLTTFILTLGGGRNVFAMKRAARAPSKRGDGPDRRSITQSDAGAAVMAARNTARGIPGTLRGIATL